MLCYVWGFSFALPLGQYPLGIPPDKRHTHQHSKVKEWRLNKLLCCTTFVPRSPRAVSWETNRKEHGPVRQAKLHIAALCIPTGLPQRCAYHSRA